ncbi:hypothetical protein AtEden1_Chr3g0198561 [Arabidopsis thaliana]
MSRNRSHMDSSSIPEDFNAKNENQTQEAEKLIGGLLLIKEK